jgi:hypothetical protein
MVVKMKQSDPIENAKLYFSGGPKRFLTGRWYHACPLTGVGGLAKLVELGCQYEPLRG